MTRPEPGDRGSPMADGGQDWEGRAAEEAPGAAPRGLLVVELGEARFGVWADEVMEIVETPPISRLPVASAELAGVTHVRGDVIPVLDLGLRLLSTPAKRPGRLVLARNTETATVVGLLVDRATSLLPVGASEVGPPPRPAESGLRAGVASGLVAAEDGAVTVLHLGRATAPPGSTSKEA